MECFPSRLETRQACLILPLLLDTVLYSRGSGQHEGEGSVGHGLNVCPPHSYGEPQSKKVIRVKWGHQKGGPDPTGLVSLRGAVPGGPRLSLYLHTESWVCRDTATTTHEPREEASEWDLLYQHPWSCTSQSPELRLSNSLCWSHPICTI